MAWIISRLGKDSNFSCCGWAAREVFLLLQVWENGNIVLAHFRRRQPFKPHLMTITPKERSKCTICPDTCNNSINVNHRAHLDIFYNFCRFASIWLVLLWKSLFQGVWGKMQHSIQSQMGTELSNGVVVLCYWRVIQLNWVFFCGKNGKY